MYVCSAHITCLDRRLARCIAIYTNNVCSRDSVCADEVTYNTTAFVPFAVPWYYHGKEQRRVCFTYAMGYVPVTRPAIAADWRKNTKNVIRT